MDSKKIDNYRKTFSTKAKDAISSCFSIFVSNLSIACNLESLTLNLSDINQSEYDGKHLKSILQIFSMNLTKCTKLKDLTVADTTMWVKCKSSGKERLLYSVALMEALTPTIVQQKNVMQSLKLTFTGRPTDAEHESRENYQVARDFYSAVLSPHNLVELHIDNVMGSSTTHVLHEVAEKNLHLYGQTKSNLQHLMLRNHLPHFPFFLDSPVAHIVLLISFFSGLNHLQSINVLIPKKCWAERQSKETFLRLIKHKPELKIIRLDFDL